MIRRSSLSLLSMLCATSLLCAENETQRNYYYYPKHQEPRASLDRLIGFIYPDTLSRRLYELVHYLSWGHPLDAVKYAWIYEAVRDLSIKLNVPMPQLNVLSHMRVNSLLWTGKINLLVYGWSPEDASITITQDAIDLLTQDEMRGYLAYGVAQIAYRYIVLSRPDTLLSYTTPLSRLLIADFVKTQVLIADYHGAIAVNDPQPLIEAIRKEYAHAGLPYTFMSLPIISWFSSWPTAEQRISYLQQLSTALPKRSSKGKKEKRNVS